jgi:hypothetical protein
MTVNLSTYRIFSPSKLFLLLIIPLILESCTYRYCHTYQSSYRKGTREVALKGKRKAYAQGYSIYKR